MSTKKKKKRGPNKAVRMRRLLKKCKEAASLLVRLRDNGCVICALNGVVNSDPKKLNAHHWIISYARSVKHRFNPVNLVSLCWAHHLHGVHKEASYAYLLKIKEAVIARGVATEKEIDLIARDTEAVEPTEEWLACQLAELQRGVSLDGQPPIVAAGSCNESTSFDLWPV